MRERLNEFRTAILAISDQAKAHLNEPDVERAEALMRLRTRMAQALTSYQLYIHREVFEPMIACGDPAQAAAAKTLKLECIVLAEDYRAYVRRWHAADVTSHWEEYQPAAAHFVRRIRSHLDMVRAL